MTIRFDNRIAVVTGAGAGLGRAHALGLAERGAKVIVNDLGDASGQCESAERVVEEIRSLGGEALSHGADVTDMGQVTDMMDLATKTWGRVDILVNNAGILRDKSFGNLTLDDFQQVFDVHLMGSVNCTKACWATMREQAYGRIVVTTSTSGIYGNFGQSNYGAAKTGVIGLMNVLGLEGAKYDIKVNALSPAAGTQMTEGLMEDELFQFLSPGAVTPGLLYLVSEDAPDRVILSAGAGGFSVTKIKETPGIWLHESDRTPETIAARWLEISDSHRETHPRAGADILQNFVTQAETALGRKLR